jgi:predicted aspartyl protease
MSQWRPPDYLSDANGKTLIVNKKKTSIASRRRYSEVCVQVINSDGKGRMLRALLDSGCSKSIMLKQFTEKKRRSKLMGRDQVEYAIYGGKFQSKSSASVGFKLIEFANKQQINYKFQVDEVQSSQESRYDMIIGSDLLNELSIDIQYSDNCIEWEGDIIQIKNLGELQDRMACELIYNLHTDGPILKEHEERQAAILDANYSKVDIGIMVDELDIEESSKTKLKLTLNKFPTLFGGGSGRLNIPPVSIELKKDAKRFQGRYYNIPKAFESSTRKEVDRMCDIDVLHKPTYEDDSPWAAPLDFMES